MNLVKELLWHFQHLYLHVSRSSENMNAYAQWAKPVKRARGHVSGDALAHWVKELGEYPLPNIWEGK